MAKVISNSLLIATTISFDLLAPARKSGPLAIVLHGYGGTSRKMIETAQEFVPKGWGVLAVQGPHQHTRLSPRTGKQYPGYGWGTLENPSHAASLHQKGLLKIIEWAVRQRIANAHQIVLAGFSEPVPLNYLLASQRAGLLAGLLAFCGLIPPVAQARNLPPVLHLVGASDPVVPYSNAAVCASELRLRGTQIDFAVHEGGHEITLSMKQEACEWLRGLGQSKIQKGRRLIGRNAHP